MKRIVRVAFIATVSGLSSYAQPTGLPSNVFRWADLTVEKKTSGERRAIVEDKTSHLSYLEMHATTIGSGLAPHAPHHHDDEELILVKEGKVRITIAGQSKDIGPGGIALIHSNEEHGMVNIGTRPATYYVMRYRGNAMDRARGERGGGSRLLSKEDLEAMDTGKGTRTNYFDQSTSAVDNFEMHVTSLRKDQESHAPHTHEAEEIILIISGNVQMYIGGEYYNASVGDVIFLAANDPHALKNLTDGDCEYFAFQWK